MLLFRQDMTQNPRAPDLVAQRVAMGKLSFLAGEWIGRASIRRGPGKLTELVQTENVQYKLDGLVLVIEGVGRANSDGQPVLQALGLISYDDQRMVYQMRAFNEGRFLETEVKLSERGKSMTWGFTLGDIRTKSVLRMDENGQWTELHEITIGSEAPRKLMEVAVRRQR
jgi:hypothetical protein